MKAWGGAMIEHDFDVPFIADLALREKQIQQNYRPVIAVHKWFARRPGTLFRGLLLSEFSSRPLREVFYQANDLAGIRIADPFMGGGIPLLEANRAGCNVIGYDINPMSYWIVRQEIETIDLDRYGMAAERLRRELDKKIGRLYRTRCIYCGDQDVPVKYFLWVKVKRCGNCGEEIPLFPGYLVSQNRRHPKNVFLCSVCGNLTETEDRQHPGECSSCGKPISDQPTAKRNSCVCPACDAPNRYPDPKAGPPIHRLFALEYHCPHCRPRHKGRFFKKPDEEDLSFVEEADSLWREIKPIFAPDDPIPHGDESTRLHRWGYNRYLDLFNARQLLGLELSCRFIVKEGDRRIRDALATNLSDLLRYQNMLCRYDKMALKSLDIFSVHGFPVGLIQCESNILGIKGHRGGSIGSGGWLNIIEKFRKAKSYCTQPFETDLRGKRKYIIPIPGEWIGDNGNEGNTRSVDLSCADATVKELPAGSLDGVFTDPPYFGNVQYAELMDFCYAWLRRLVGESVPAFIASSTRNVNELTGNENMGRDLCTFTEGLSSVFRRMAKALKPGSPLVFTYHHNAPYAYYPVAVAILDAGLTCSASLPCPSEMGASIHINGTGSSIIDTVFVSRSTGRFPRKWLPEDAEGLASIVEEDLHNLRLGEVGPTYGDLRCIILGHLTRLAIWNLRKEWHLETDTEKKLSAVDGWVEQFGGLSAVEEHLDLTSSGMPRIRFAGIQEPESAYRALDDEISF
jgi:putative DNA methylase